MRVVIAPASSPETGVIHAEYIVHKDRQHQRRACIAWTLEICKARNSWGKLTAERFLSGEVHARGTDGQRSVQDAFLLPQMIGELLDLHRRSADENHFGTQVVVEVYMRGRQNGVIIMVLQFDKFFTELTDMVIVHQGDCSQRFLLGVLPFVRHE